jgi:hypothetical protein
VAADGSGRRTADAAASEGTKRRKPRREAAEADTLRWVEAAAAAVAVRCLAPRREPAEEGRGLKKAAGLGDGAWDSIAGGLLGDTLIVRTQNFKSMSWSLG